MINAIDPNQLLAQMRAMQSQAQSAPVNPQQINPSNQVSDVMIASQKASVAFEATVQVRNKFVEAYQEVMRMSI